jgi:hypothetical protein
VLDHLDWNDSGVGEGERGIADDRPGAPGDHTSDADRQERIDDGVTGSDSHQPTDDGERDECIGSRMFGVGAQDRAVELASAPAFPRADADIHEQRDQHDGEGEGSDFWLNAFLETMPGVLENLHDQETHRARDDQRGQRLEAPVPVGVVGIGRARRDGHADESDNVR